MQHVFGYASRSTKGARDYQEDMSVVSPLVDDESAVMGKPDADATARPQSAGDDARAYSKVVAVLADGMGGHTGGALASQLVCDAFVGAYRSNDDERVSERLFDALTMANDVLATRVAAEPVLSGMGSTLVGVSFGDFGVHWVSVGDSPLYLFRRGEIAHVNEDHSLAPELDRLAAAGRISAEEARQDPRRSMLRSAVTGDEIDLIDRSRNALQLEPDDYVILASDGLQTLEDSEIERIVAAYSADGPDAVAAALIRSVEAVRAPHQDNATVVAVRVSAGPGAPAQAGSSALQQRDDESVTTGTGQ